MTVNLYYSADAKNKLDRSLTSLATKTGTLKDETSILKPTILFEGTISDIARATEMFIPKFGRYYFITDIASLRANLYAVSGEVDVLKTYADQIKLCEGLVVRTSNSYNNTYYDLESGTASDSGGNAVSDWYLTDEAFRTRTSADYQYLEFSNGNALNVSTDIVMLAGSSYYTEIQQSE